MRELIVERPCEDQSEHPDADALRALFDALCRFAYRYVGAVEEARDVVQDVFLRVWETRAAVPLHAGLRTYLYTLVRNRAVDCLRRRRCHHYIEEPAHLSGPPGLSGRDGDDPRTVEDDVLSAEVAQQIADAVAALPPRQREIIGLRWREGASYAQIATQLGISEKTISEHIQRAMRHLRDSLQDLTNT